MEELFYRLLSSPITTIAIIAASFFLLSIILPRRNWRNAPPGPTGWPILGYLPYLSDRVHEDLHKLSFTYGPLFSLQMGQKPAIVVSSPEMTKEMLKHKDLSFSSRAITEAVKCLAYGGTSLVFVPYGARWRLLRKVLNTELFSTRAMDLLLPARQKQIRRLVSNINTAWQSNTPVNIADSTFVASINLICDLVCSKCHFDDSKEGRALKAMVMETSSVMGSPNIVDLIPWLKIFDPQGLTRRAAKMAKKFDAFFERLIEDRLEERRRGIKINENGRMDMLDVFLDYRSDKKEDEITEFSRDDIKGMLADVFIAGADTSSSTIEWGMTEILRNPVIYKKVLDELDEVVGKSHLVEEADINKLTCLQAVVKEVYRLHPAVPLLIPRRNDEAVELCGYSVPKHATVFVNVWSIGRNPSVWPDPSKFNPDRFIGSEIDVKGQDFELLPFGTGRRVCSGLTLGNRLVHYSLATLLHAFEWDFSAEILEDTKEKAGITLQKVKSLVGKGKPRLPDSVYQQYD